MEKSVSDALPLGYEQPDLWDRLLAFLLGLAACSMSLLAAFPGLHPLAWNDAAVASRLVPPETIAPGLARLVDAGVFRAFGAADGLTVLTVLGAAFGGVAVMLFYLTLREFLPAVLSLRGESRRWTFLLERLVTVAGTLVFFRAEPVFRLTQTFSSALLIFVGILLFFRLYLRLLHYGNFVTAYACLFLLGVLAAETPLGLVLAIGAFVATLVVRTYSWRPDLRYLNPMLMELSKWRLTLFFVLGFAGAAGADAVYFAMAGGPAAVGLSGGELVVDWIVRYGRAAAAVATPLGWILFALFALVPFVVAACNARRATDDDAFLPFKIGILFAVLALVSLLPLSSVPHVRFWGWTARPSVVSPYVLALGATALAVVFTLALAVFFYDIWCRDHRRIALQRFPELIEDGDFARQHFHWRWRKTITAVTLAIVGLAVAPSGRDFAVWDMACVLDGTIRGTVSECAGVRGIVTDGALDDALRLASAAKGRTLIPLSMMAGTAAYPRGLRLAFADNPEDEALLALGVPQALRSWATERPERLKDVAVQLGFENWRDRRTERPPAAGFSLRQGLSSEQRAACAAVARTLSERAVAIQKNGRYDRCEDPQLKEKFLFAQWRLARIAAIRAEGDVTARADAALAEELDDRNPELTRIRTAVNWLHNRNGDALAPREGLRIALERADFLLARRYATPILNSDAENPDANFGMGMSYFIEENWVRAEKYLTVSLKRRPDEPAVLNNLAVCCYKLKRYEEARSWAQKALKRLPDAPAVRATYDEIVKAIEREKGK